MGNRPPHSPDCSYSTACPINKKIWSPTFVLVTTGFAAQLLGLLIWIIDIRKKRRWSRFFHAFGVNPLIVYVFAGMVAVLFSNIRFTWQGEAISIKAFTYEVLLQPWARKLLRGHCSTRFSSLRSAGYSDTYSINGISTLKYNPLKPSSEHAILIADSRCHESRLVPGKG